MNKFIQRDLSLLLSSDLVESKDQSRVDGRRLLCRWVQDGYGQISVLWNIQP